MDFWWRVPHHWYNNDKNISPHKPQHWPKILAMPCPEFYSIYWCRPKPHKSDLLDCNIKNVIQCCVWTFKIHNPETTHSFVWRCAADVRIECCDTTLQHIQSWEKVRTTGPARDSSAWQESEKTEDERGHLLWPRQSINKQTRLPGYQDTHSEQTGALANLPAISRMKPGCLQVGKGEASQLHIPSDGIYRCFEIFEFF